MKDRVVETQYGAVSGVASDTEGVVLFKGIPIGADTAGQNRFREPQPAAPWEGIRVCDTWPDRFLQELSGREPGSFWGDEFYYDPNYNPGNSENGLAVNVFAPEKGCGEEQTEPLPVFVYIHSGFLYFLYFDRPELTKLCAQPASVTHRRVDLHRAVFLPCQCRTAGS